jgi:GTP diphosphokinase / guanosine-3',5'-bis(diphosphate) 3'-diphosphatase
MVSIETIQEIRPRLTSEFGFIEFEPRTPAMQDAYCWGVELHKGQKRMSGEPYFETHCAWVASFLDRLVGNEAWTIGGLLHDSVEDKGISLDDIRARFPGALGEDVAYIVNGVTKLSTPQEGRSRELETLRKIAKFRDPAVYLVKLADKSHNLLTLEYMSPEKRVKKAEEAIRAYGKLAGILNCYKWRRWLEDMAFPYADPETFAFVKQKIDSDPRLQPAFINDFMGQLGKIMEKYGIDGRVEIIVNGYWQAWQKLRRMARMRKTSLDSFVAVNDIVSFRMIVDSEDEAQCYALLLGVNRFLGPYLDQNRFDDYIAYPQNGYRALQITAYYQDYGAIEVAICNAEMEGENQWGVVYDLKHGKDISGYHPVVFLTPTGGVRFAPEGSTVLDAVASIQQEFLLDKISAVKINDNLARLSDKISPGDVVEVITGGRRIKPSEDWLSYCNASTARLLRVVLASEALRRDAEQGQKQIKNVLGSRGILSLEDVQELESVKIDILLEQLACISLEDLYSALGGGAIRLLDFARALDEAGICKEDLSWTTINIIGSPKANKPGMLSRLTGMISARGGNILRSVNNTQQDGSFALRLVVKNLVPENEQLLAQSFANEELNITSIELV